MAEHRAVAGVAASGRWRRMLSPRRWRSSGLGVFLLWCWALNARPAAAVCTGQWRDDFSAGQLDRSRWRIIFHGPASNGAFWWSADDVAVEGGALVLTMARGAAGWTAGGISQGGPGTRFGLYQVRARVEAGQGVGPAILLWPASNGWPGPEMDFMESPNASRSSVWVTQHWRGARRDNALTATQIPIDATHWHVYAADWKPGSLDFLIDGVIVAHSVQHISAEPAWLALQGFVADPNDSWYGGAPGAATPSIVRLFVQWASVSAACSAGEDP